MPTRRKLVRELDARRIEAAIAAVEARTSAEIRVSVAPFFVGDSRARRFVDDGRFPWCAGRHARLVETRSIGDVVLLRYALSQRCREG